MPEERRKLEAAMISDTVQACAQPAMSSVPGRGLRVALMAGTGNVRGALELLARGEHDSTNSHVGYSEQVARACQSVGASELLALTYFGAPNSAGWSARVGALRVSVEQIPHHFLGRRGLRFHAASFEHARHVRGVLERFRPDVLVVSDDPPRALALAWMRTAGCKLVRVHHCAITPPLLRRTLAQRVLLGVDSVGMRGSFDAVLSASSVVSDQVRQLFPGAPIAEFLPHFDRELHTRIQPLPRFSGELRCVFVGRIEPSKGVFDLHAALQEALRRGARVSVDVCGDGSAMSELRRLVASSGSSALFRLHGWCNREQMQALVARAHLGVIPTRSEFGEGFNQAAIELLLSGRPVLTSRAIPAACYAPGAVRVVKHDDPHAYADDLARLATPAGFTEVERIHQACEAEVAKFLRPETSYQAALEHVLRELMHGNAVRERCVGFDGSIRAAA
jgi:glycogen(starch) synthase